MLLGINPEFTIQWQNREQTSTSLLGEIDGKNKIPIARSLHTIWFFNGLEEYFFLGGGWSHLASLVIIIAMVDDNNDDDDND